MVIRRRKLHSRMTAEELRKATREFDREFVADEAKPLNAKQRAEDAAARKRGRPVRGKGAARINVTVELGLLERADNYAERNGVTRAQLIARGLELALGGGRGGR